MLQPSTISRVNQSIISLRPVTAADQPFLLQVYGSTRQEELNQVPWSEAEKAAFVQMQFTAQHAYYQEHYPNASMSLILEEGNAVGRLYIDRRSEEIRIMDIALLPEFRNRGIGSHLLNTLLHEADRTDTVVTIHVEKFNPALSLYTRLGFVPAGEVGVYWFMKWTPKSIGTRLEQ